LRQRIGDQAFIAVIAKTRTSYILSQLPDMQGLAAWNGAVRLLRPGAQPGDPFTSHPLICQQPDFLDNVCRSLESQLRRDADVRPGVETEIRDHASDQDRELGELRDQSSQQYRELSDLRKQSAEKDRLISELRQQVQKQAKQLKSQSATVDELVWSDPEKQLNYEINEAWLRQVAEYDRDQYPLPDRWVLGVDFLASLGEMTVVSRDVVIATIVDVLTGRAASISGRYVHMQRKGAVGDQLVRHDGAGAWRASVRQGIAASPRLLWWRHQDNTIELGRVTLHDDMYLR
jgi:hypothetical protein